METRNRENATGGCMTIECPICGLIFDVHDTHFACPGCDRELVLKAEVSLNMEEYNGTRGG